MMPLMRMSVSKMIYSPHKPLPFTYKEEDPQCAECGSNIQNHYWKCEDCESMGNTFDNQGDPVHECDIMSENISFAT